MTRYLSEAVDVEEGLEFGVHESGGALVFQPDVSRLLL